MSTDTPFIPSSAAEPPPDPSALKRVFSRILAWPAAAAAMAGVQGTLAALVWRDRSGLGQHVETSLLAAEIEPGTALKLTASITGIARNDLYRLLRT